MTEQIIDFKLSKKQIDVLRTTAQGTVFEGTTASGKTTIAIPKFMFEVARSSNKLHAIVGLDTGTVEKNIINKDFGLLDVFEDTVIYYGAGKSSEKMPHIEFRVPKKIGKEIVYEVKIIYIVGYADKAKWKKILGGQYGVILIDEINVADYDFVKEIMMRCDMWFATLNPDDPNLAVYDDYINPCRPLEKYKKDVPEQIYKELLKVPPHENWVYWFFTFYDNPSLSKEKIAQIMESVPKDTKQYKNRIQGLRGRHAGLVFSAFNEEKHVISQEWLNVRMNQDYINDDKIRFQKFIAGVDTSYSRISDDKIVFMFQGLTEDGKKITLATQTYNNRDRSEMGLHSLSPSDIPPLLHDFLDTWSNIYGRPHYIFIDSADQATITEVDKYVTNNGSIYSFAQSYKKMKIIDRVQLENGWFAKGKCLIVKDTNQDYINELNVYAWLDSGKDPEDANDHTINANQYCWLPYVDEIGEI